MIDFSKGFRNTVYDFRSSQMVFWGWDENSERVVHREDFKPYLYTETSGDHHDALSIFGTKLRKIEFRSTKDRQLFIEKHPTGRVFHSFSTEQQYVMDACRSFSTQQLTQMPLRTFFLDIEVNCRVWSENTKIQIRHVQQSINTSNELQENILQYDGRCKEHAIQPPSVLREAPHSTEVHGWDKSERESCATNSTTTFPCTLDVNQDVSRKQKIDLGILNDGQQQTRPTKVDVQTICNNSVSIFAESSKQKQSGVFGKDKKSCTSSSKESVSNVCVRLQPPSKRPEIQVSMGPLSSEQKVHARIKNEGQCNNEEPITKSNERRNASQDEKILFESEGRQSSKDIEDHSDQTVTIKEFINKKLYSHELWVVYDVENKQWVPFASSCYAKTAFPHANEAKHPINVITIYDTLEEQFVTWGTDKFSKPRLNRVLGEQGVSKIDDSKLTYYHCRNEVDLMQKFIQFWRENYPDVVSGWNIAGFDIPYLTNRIVKLFGENQHLVLSPVNRIMIKPIVNQFGAPSVKTQISGISIVDYMELYKTFSRSDSDSYKLGDVASKELKITKIKHGLGDLVTLADNDWDLFVCYNIQDVNLLVLLEQQLNFLGIARFVSVNGFTKVENALGKVTIVQGAIASQALVQGRILPTFRISQTVRGEYSGGYVREPVRGMHGNLVSYDANSLYPNAIITLNISPECKVGKIESKPNDANSFGTSSDKYVITSPSGKRVSLSQKEFDDLIVNGICTVTSADVLYSQKKKGIIPNFIDGLYKQRVEMQKQLADIEKQQHSLAKDDPKQTTLKQKAKQLDNIQYSTKILLNSIYGNFANMNSCLFDLDAAASITMSGQSVVKQAAEIGNVWARNKFDNQSVDIVRYGDTDSCYFSLDGCCSLFDKSGKITPQSREIINELDTLLNDQITTWAKQTFHTTDSRFVFKREALCEAGVFFDKKKRYILHVNYKGDTYNDKANKLKYTGVDVVRSTFSDTSKSIVKSVITKAFECRNQELTKQHYYEQLAKFHMLDIDDISTRVSLGTLDKYQAGSNGLNFASKTPAAVAGAIAHNYLIDRLGLGSKYPKLTQGNKVKFVYVERNSYGLDGISYGERFPEEFGLVPNRTMMFEKVVRSSLTKTFTAIDWELPNSKFAPTQTLLQAFG